LAAGKAGVFKNDFILENKVMIELWNEYANILFSNDNYDYADKVMQVFVDFEASEKEGDFEINIITLSGGGLYLKQLDITPTVLDIDLYYNDDFKAVHTVIIERLAKDNDKGIVLLHGVPGTGKNNLPASPDWEFKKKILFVSPGVAGELMNPDLSICWLTTLTPSL
jgi:hypothetical protein